MASESTEPKEEYHFFSGKDSPLHPHHKAEFVVDGVKYSFVEQYVLHKKAGMCNATKDAAELMKMTNASQLKQFEKKFIVTDVKLWDTKYREFMMEGYLAKGRQVKALFDLLHDTKGKSLVYATRKDSHLGIGVDTNDPLSRRKSNWKGKNLLGEWLMEVREELPDQLDSSVDDIASKEESTGGKPQHRDSLLDKGSQGSEKFTLFWKIRSPFSQWHPCSFVIDDQRYNCTEQYMMHQKAVTFRDHQSAERILKSTDPKEQKHLGRKVADLDSEKWSPIAIDVVRRGNLAKFGQNENLKRQLFETAGTTLVEASPVDAKWGIGLAADDPRAQDRSNWRGMNQLGQILTEVREELMSRERGKVPSKDGGGSLGAGGGEDAAGKLGKRRVDDINRGQERKGVDGVSDAKVQKSHDRTGKESTQGKGDSHGGKNIRSREQRQNSSRRKGEKEKEEHSAVEMKSEVEESVNQDHLTSRVNDKPDEIMASSSLSKTCNEVPVPAEEMEYSDSAPHVGNGETGEAVDPAWEGFNKMELDVEEGRKEKKGIEGSKGDCLEKNDNETIAKKGKTRYSTRREQDKPETRSKFDGQASLEKFTFFWRADSPFSQHHPADFTIDGTQYNCAEQFMMHQKAVVFGDDRIGYEIMHTTNPAHQKSLAKQVAGFDDVHWKTLRRDVVKKGNIAKFSQNPRLRRMLFATAGTTMVEASPQDNTWGIGLHADDPKAWCRKTWEGGNLLGEIVTEVREELMEKFKDIRDDEGGLMSDNSCRTNGSGHGEQYTVFWRPVSPFHPRYPVGFVLENQYYWTLQQYLLHQKALFFEDNATARAVMEHMRPNKLEELGRKVRNYDQHSWSKVCRSYLRQGNFAKFSQNHNIGQQLIDNVLNGELVYAVEDRLLGVGFRNDDGRLYKKKSWKGKNLLGRALMEVRDVLLKGEQTLLEIVEDPEDEVAAESSSSSEVVETPEFHFFFSRSVFSQWQTCRFSIGRIQYHTAEQYMFHQMALHFHDRHAAETIMRCRQPRDLQYIPIRGFNQHSWENVCREIVTEGNRAKFKQGSRFVEELLKTEDAVLAYASVNDTFLGIGLRDTDPLVHDQRNWPGYNVLGEVLMELREELKEQSNNSNNSSNRTGRFDSREITSYHRNDQPSEKFTFFWQKSPFSQWWRCSIEIDGIVYNCSEQYMMHQKALYFGDLRIANDIMRTDIPYEQWQLGRRIPGYSNDKWNAVCKDIVKTANLEKFIQHPKMRQMLFETAGTTLVEASPKDCKWGIGVGENDHRAERRETWLGTNLLGEILTEVRDELMKEESYTSQAVSASNVTEPGPRHDRRGPERSDNSQGRWKDSESHAKGYPYEPSYQKSRYDRGGAVGKPSQHSDRGNQWSRQNPRAERGDTSGRANQHHHEDHQWSSHQNSRSFYGERSNAAEARQYQDRDRQSHQDRDRQSHQDRDRQSHQDRDRQSHQDRDRQSHQERDRQSHQDRDRQRQPEDSSSDQHRYTEKRHQAEESRFSIPIGRSEKNFARKQRSNPSGQKQRTHNQDSKATTSHSGGATKSSSGGDNSADSRGVIDEAASSENIHIISENASLGLWHRANFKVDEFKYRSVGQYIFHQKALMFNDGITADEIMNSTSVKRILKCDKYIDGFSEKKWNTVYRDVIKDGNYYKLSQNEELKEELLATTDSVLAYADANDRTLGVGLKPDDIRNRKRWKGENMLGFVLMEVRDDLINGRDPSKTRRVLLSTAEANDDALTEITEEDKAKDVQEETVEEDKTKGTQEQTPDGDTKAVNGEEAVSLDMENLGVSNSSCPQYKSEQEKNSEVVAIAVSEGNRTTNASEVQTSEILQEIAVPEGENLQEMAVPKEENIQETAVPKEENLQEMAVPKEENLQETAVPKEENLQETAVPKEKNLQETAVLKEENLQETAVPEGENLQETAVPKEENLQGTVDSQKGSLQQTAVPENESLQDAVVPEKESLQETAVLKEANLEETAVCDKENLQDTDVPKAISDESNVVELSDALEGQPKVKATEVDSEKAVILTDKETEVKYSQVTKEVVPTIDTPQSSCDDTQNSSTASETSENDEIAMIDSCSEPAEFVSKTELAVKKALEVTNIDVTDDSILVGVSEVGSVPTSHQTPCNAMKASDTTDTLESQPTSQNEDYDKQKREDFQTVESQALATNKIFTSQQDGNTAESDAGKRGETETITIDSANDESHPEETVSTAPVRNGLEDEVDNNCLVTSVKETMSEKMDMIGEIVNEIYQDAVLTAIKTETLKVQGGNEEIVEQASTTVKEKADDDSETDESESDESKTEIQPEEAISASMTETISHGMKSLTGELDKKENVEDDKEPDLTEEKEAVEAETKNSHQERYVTPAGKTTSGAEINGTDNVVIAEGTVVVDHCKNENTNQINTSVEEELEDKSSFESHEECVSTSAKTEMLHSDTNSEGTRPADVEVTGERKIKLTEELDDETEENLANKNNVESIPEDDLIPAAVTGVSEVKDGSITDISCQETKLVKDEADVEAEARLGDKSSVENIPDKTSVPTAVKEVLETQSSPEESDEEKTSEEEDDKSSDESIPEEASRPTAVKEVLETKSSSSSEESDEEKTSEEEDDKSSDESIPKEASRPTAVKEVLETQSSPEETDEEKTSEEDDDTSSDESYKADAESVVAEKKAADAERACKATSPKEEMKRTKSTEAEASQQVTAICPETKEDLQTCEGNSETAENSDQQTS